MKTIKVRIAVAVSASGKWEAAGGVGWREIEAKSHVRYNVDSFSPTGEAVRVVWVTAEVPLPEDAELVGEVENG